MRPSSPDGDGISDSLPLLRVHLLEDDLRSLHAEVEKAGRAVGIKLETFLDASSFWETPLRARALPQAAREVCREVQAECVTQPGRAATDRELQLCGTTAARYLRQLRRAAQRARKSKEGWVWLDSDMSSAFTNSTEAAARRAVGAVLSGAEWATLAAPNDGVRRAVVLARPPGHHNGCDERLEELDRNAWRHAAHGGCIFNETAVAIRHLRARASSPLRFAVVDLDVHFGDGTAWHFYEDPDVLCVSVHLDQSDSHVFPYLKGKAEERGSGKGLGTTLNLPLAEGAGDAEATRLLQEYAWPAAREHRPDMLFVSLGFDGLQGDPAGAGIQYTAAFFEHAVEACCALCPRTVCTLQGGYQPDDMAEAVAAVLRVLAGRPPSRDLSGTPSKEFQEAVAGLGRKLHDPTLWWSVGRSFDYVPVSADGEDMEESPRLEESSDDVAADDALQK